MSTIVLLVIPPCEASSRGARGQHIRAWAMAVVSRTKTRRMQRARYAKVIMKASDAGLQGIFRTHSIIYAVLSLQRFPKHNAPQTSCLFRWTQPTVYIREISYQNLSPQLRRPFATAFIERTLTLLLQIWHVSCHVNFYRKTFSPHLACTLVLSQVMPSGRRYGGMLVGVYRVLWMHTQSVLSVAVNVVAVCRRG